MCVCMYVCMCVCMCVCIYVYIRHMLQRYTCSLDYVTQEHLHCAYACVCMYVCIYGYTCMHVCLYICIFLCICVANTCMHVCLYICIFLCICVANTCVHAPFSVLTMSDRTIFTAYIHVCMYECMGGIFTGCMYACTHTCTQCMHACTYVCCQCVCFTGPLGDLMMHEKETFALHICIYLCMCACMRVDMLPFYLYI
jgi:hypothetical protein